MSEKMFAYIAIVVGVAVMGLIYFITSKTSNPSAKYNRGRDYKTDKAVSAARSFARSNGFRFLGPVTLSSGGHTAHIDAMIIGYFGILGVKAYGYNQTIYGAADDKEWLQVGYQRKRHTFPNPVLEASADVRVVRDALLKAKLKQVPLEVVCVFTHPKVQMTVPKNVGQLTFPEYKAVLEKSKYLEDKGLEPEKIEAAIRAVEIA